MCRFDWVNVIVNVSVNPLLTIIWGRKWILEDDFKTSVKYYLVLMQSIVLPEVDHLYEWNQVILPLSLIHISEPTRPY